MIKFSRCNLVKKQTLVYYTAWSAGFITNSTTSLRPNKQPCFSALFHPIGWGHLTRYFCILWMHRLSENDKERL